MIDIEQLAEIEHQRWADWQGWCHKILRENCPSPELEAVLERWDKQIATPYKDLSEQEKQSDRDQVDRYLPLIKKAIQEAVDDALATSGDTKQPSVSKPLTLDRLKDLVGGNLRKNEPDYGRRQFVMGYNQAKDEIRERILTW